MEQCSFLTAPSIKIKLMFVATETDAMKAVKTFKLNNDLKLLGHKEPEIC